MKKQIFTILGLVITLAFASCERSYTCICVYPNSSISTSRTNFKSKKRIDAEEKCRDLNAAARSSGGSCALE